MDTVSFVQLQLPFFSDSEERSKFDDQLIGSDVDSEMVPLNLPRDVASMLMLMERPAGVERSDGKALMAKSD